MRGREHVPAAEAEQLIRPRAVAPEPPLLALQRAAGNRAVTALLAREDKKTPASDQPPRAGGWNEKPQGVGGSHRFPVTGLAGGNRKTDAQDATRESAVGSAVVVVPDAADLSKPFEVLLLFHGVGIGYRERTKPAPVMPVGDAGTVRDVEADLIPQQLAHSDRNIVGVLAQGLMGGGGRFGITDPNAYVLDVLKKAAPAIQKELPTAKCPADPAPARTILAGHSGGGPEATAQADAATPATAPKDKAQWINRPRLMIFDGIHGPDELGKVVALAKRWVKEDIGIVTSEGKAALAERGLKLRSTFSTGGWKGYTAYNVGGTIPEEEGGGRQGRHRRQGRSGDGRGQGRPGERAPRAPEGADRGGGEGSRRRGRTAQAVRRRRAPGLVPRAHDGRREVARGAQAEARRLTIRADGAVGQGRPALRRRRLPRRRAEEASRRREAAPDATDARKRSRPRARPPTPRPRVVRRRSATWRASSG